MVLCDFQFASTYLVIESFPSAIVSSPYSRRDGLLFAILSLSWSLRPVLDEFLFFGPGQIFKLMFALGRRRP